MSADVVRARGRSPIRAACLQAIRIGLLLAVATAAQAGPGLIVKLRGEGPHALDACAERLFARGESFTRSTADASPSLDDATQRAGVRGIRALFRRPDGRSFSSQRDRLKQRLARRAQPRAGAPARRGAPEPLPDLAHVYRFEISEGSSLEQAEALLASDPHVAWVQQDHAHELDQVGPPPPLPPLPGDLPDDPFVHSSGSWGQAYADLWGWHRIRTPEAWRTARGEGVVVAVVDTGLDYDHPDIADNVWVNPGEDLDGNGRVDPSDWNGVDDDDNGFVDDLRGFDFANSVDADQDGRFDGPDDVGDPDPFDDRGHGTHVAGTIAAVADNGIGIAGVAPAATLMALKGFPAEGPGRDSDLWRAVLYAAENGARVINNSWSCNPLCPSNPLAEEVVAIVHAMGVVIVTSAGNRQTDVVFNSPEHLRETITVASSNFDDRPSDSFTNFGWGVDVAAPGGGPSDDPSVRIARRNILSLRSSADDSAEYATVAEGYWRLSGTSMAAPHVAGAVALLLSADPGLDYESVRRLIRQGAVDTGPPGPDRDMGAGRLDAAASLHAMPLPDLRAAITAPTQGSVFAPRAGAVLEIRGTAAGDDLESFELRYGRGNVPAEWLPIAAAAAPVEEDVLARWSLAGLDEGTYVVRLDVYGSSGEAWSEFLVLSLERNHFREISAPGRPAEDPDISDRMVVWESRRDPDDPDAPSDDYNLFASSFSGKHHFLVSGAPGHQQSASIDDGVVTWLDSRNELDLPEAFACRLDASHRCQAVSASDGFGVSVPPAAAAGRVFWVDDRTGQLDIRGCRPGPNADRCEPAATGLEPARRSFLRANDDTLAWSQAGQRVGVCRVDGSTGACHDRSPTEAIWAFSRPAASGSLLAWVEVDFRNRRPLVICEIETESGECLPIRVMEGVEDAVPVMSGNRLVWDTGIGDEASDVFFCEFDSVRQRCPVQRVTAHHAPQEASAIDGRHLVWQDERAGAARIQGIVLPGLREIRDRRVRAGRYLAIPVLPLRDSKREAPLRLGVEAVGPASVAELGAHFVSGRDWALLLWRPGRDQVGSHAFTFEGTTPDGLVTRRTVRVEVLPAPAQERWKRLIQRLLRRAKG